MEKNADNLEVTYVGNGINEYRKIIYQFIEPLNP
jgi:hypothetical protein